MQGISAVVATINRKDELKRLFDTVVSNGVSNLELIIVDQNTNGLLDTLVAEYSTKLDIVHLKRQEANQSRARNYGASFAKYPILCFPDDDCWFENDSLGKVQQYFENSDTDLLVINWKQNPKVYNTSFSLTKSKVFSFRAVGYVTYVLFFRLGVFRELGGFIEDIGIGKYIGGGEDSELTFRAVSNGYKLFFAADILVNHKYININTRDLPVIRARTRAIGLMYAMYDIPVHVIARGLIAPLLKMLVSFNTRKAKEWFNIFVARWEGLYYGLKHKANYSRFATLSHLHTAAV
jgi:glycosyltransferase involved in cell wall biosynthesis